MVVSSSNANTCKFGSAETADLRGYNRNTNLEANRADNKFQRRTSRKRNFGMNHSNSSTNVVYVNSTNHLAALFLSVMVHISFYQPCTSVVLVHRGQGIEIETNFDRLREKYYSSTRKQGNPNHHPPHAFPASLLEKQSLVRKRNIFSSPKNSSTLMAGIEEAVSLLQISDDEPSEKSNFIAACEVCTYVLDNKMQRQPYLCRGLKDPNYQRSCVQVMESLMWWLANEVYWVNYGCQKDEEGSAIWLRPCPAHAVCSWLQQLYTRSPFCPLDPKFPVPK